jgi:hypothetical protein
MFPAVTVLKKPSGTDMNVLYLGNYRVACWQLVTSSTPVRPKRTAHGIRENPNGK